MLNIDPNEISQLINKHIKEKGVTQASIAKTTGIHQSQISRIINADFKKVSKNVIELCKYAKIDLNKVKSKSINPSENGELMNAIADVWDGSNKNAKALARVIRSLKELR